MSTKTKTPTPSDDMIVLAALLNKGTDWQCAEEIASALRRLGFQISPQKMVGALRRLLAEDCPMFDVRDYPWGTNLSEYRVTRFGLNQLDQRFPSAYHWVRELCRQAAER